MEDNRGTKRSRSSSSSSSSSQSDASTPSPSPSESLPPPVSPSDVSSRMPPSPVHEHGEPFEGISVVTLSSKEEDTFLDTSRDEELARQLFGDLNLGLLGPPNDGNIIILNDSDEEEEVREEDTTDAEVTPSSTPRPQPPPPVTPLMHSIGCKMIVVMVGTRPVYLRLSRQKGCLQEACTKVFKTCNGIALLHHKFFCKRRVWMVIHNHCSLNPFCASCSFSISVMSLLYSSDSL
jgi:hypothetical protein